MTENPVDRDILSVEAVTKSGERDSVTGSRARAFGKSVTCHALSTVTDRDIDTTVTDRLKGGPSRSRIVDEIGMLEALERHLTSQLTLTPWEAGFALGCGRRLDGGKTLTDKQRAALHSVFVKVANRMGGC